MSLTSMHKTLLLGGAVFGAFLVFTIWLGPVSSSRLEERLDEAVTTALLKPEHRWARAEVNGQTVTLMGRWPDEAHREAAIEAIYEAEWAGGWLAGGITSVVDESVAQERERDSQFLATLADGQISLTGVAASAELRLSLISLAEQIAPLGVEARISVRSREDVDESWLESAEQLVAAMAELEEGLVSLDDDQALIFGYAATQAGAESAFSAFEAMTGGFERIGLVLSEEQAFAQFETRHACETLLDRVVQSGRIRFNPGSSNLSAGARQTVGHLSDVFTACPVSELTVSVRSVVGGAASSQEMALARANAVRDQLMDEGIEGALITAVANSDQDRLLELTLSERAE